MAWRCGHLLLALIIVAVFPAQAKADWLAYGGDPQVTNAVPGQGITAQNVGALVQDWRIKLDGPIVASPLYVSNVKTKSFRGDVVIAATESGSIYALRAGSGRQLWKRTFATRRACGQAWGISATPAVDRERARVYVAGASGSVFALDLSNGRTLAGWPIRVIEPEFSRVEHFWGGLRLHRGSLYVPVASYCNRPDDRGRRADGRLVRLDEEARKIIGVLDLVPGTGNQGGIWGFGGVSVDPGGKWLYAGTANSYVPKAACGCVDETVGHAEKVLRLSRKLNVVEANRPRGIPTPAGDTDFGGTPMLFQPEGCAPLAAINSKNGHFYVWRRHRINAGPIWSSTKIAPTDPNDSFIGQPSWSARHQMIYVSHTYVWQEGKRFGGMTAFRVEDGCTFAKAWVAPTGTGPQPPPIIVGNVVFSTTGAFSDDADLVALHAKTGQELWTGAVGGTVWAPPIADGGRVLAASADGNLVAFTLPSP